MDLFTRPSSPFSGRARRDRRAAAPRTPRVLSEDLAREALADLRQDFGELLYLARDSAAELASLLDDLERLPAQPVLAEHARLALARSREAASRLLGLRQQASTGG